MVVAAAVIAACVVVAFVCACTDFCGIRVSLLVVPAPVPSFVTLLFFLCFLGCTVVSKKLLKVRFCFSIGKFSLVEWCFSLVVVVSLWELVFAVWTVAVSHVLLFELAL
jgi:hypothetical protein